MTQPTTPAVTVHACPPDGSGLTPCCHRTPTELPRTDQITTDPAAVTCTPTTPATADPALAQRIAEKLAKKFTAPHHEGQPAHERLDQGMMAHFTAADGYPAMAPVTPNEAAAAVLAELAPELERAERLEAEVASVEETAADRYQNALHWQERAEQAETALTRVRAVVGKPLPLAHLEHRDEPSDEERGWAAAMAAIEAALTGPAEENTP